MSINVEAAAVELPPLPQNGFLAPETLKTTTSEDETQFVFDKTQFNRPDFNVERFIYLVSRRYALNQIHTDLRGYLRQLQNSMVALINDEYADFVKLSANLAALKESVEKVSLNVNSAWDTFGDSTTKIKYTVQSIDERAQQIVESRVRQISIRNKISLLGAFERLADCLSCPPSDLSEKWFKKLIHAATTVEHWRSRISPTELSTKVELAQTACLKKVNSIVINDLINDLHGECRCLGLIVTVLNMFGLLETGVQRVADILVRQSMDLNEKDEIVKLKAIFEQIMRLRNRWIQNYETQNNVTEDVRKFIDKALFKFILDYFDDNLATLCMPTDPPLFFQSYNLTVKFAQNFSSVHNYLDVLKALSDRFNVVLYIKRLSTPIKEEFAAKAANAHPKTHFAQSGQPQRHPFDVSNIVLTGIKHLFDPSVFLPIVADRTWEFCLQLVNQHTEWLDYCLNAEPMHIVNEINGSVTTEDRWPELVALYAGSQLFDSNFFELCLKVVFRNLEEVGADAHTLRLFLSEYRGQLEMKRVCIRQKLLKELIEIASKLLQSGVSDIPKQYRWTKRPCPTEPSTYVDESMQVLSKFGQTATLCKWSSNDISMLSSELLSGMVDQYIKGAQQVLNSVQLTGSSLQRFKRKGGSSANYFEATGSGDTDEAKIRRQLLLDTEHIRNQAASAEAPIDSLDKFMEQLKQDAT